MIEKNEFFNTNRLFSSLKNIHQTNEKFKRRPNRFSLSKPMKAVFGVKRSLTETMQHFLDVYSFYSNVFNPEWPNDFWVSTIKRKTSIFSSLDFVRKLCEMHHFCALFPICKSIFYKCWMQLPANERNFQRKIFKEENTNTAQRRHGMAYCISTVHTALNMNLNRNLNRFISVHIFTSIRISRREVRTENTENASEKCQKNIINLSVINESQIINHFEFTVPPPLVSPSLVLFVFILTMHTIKQSMRESSRLFLSCKPVLCLYKPATRRVCASFSFAFTNQINSEIFPSQPVNYVWSRCATRFGSLGVCVCSSVSHIFASLISFASCFSFNKISDSYRAIIYNIWFGFKYGEFVLFWGHHRHLPN